MEAAVSNAWRQVLSHSLARRARHRRVRVLRRVEAGHLRHARRLKHDKVLYDRRRQDRGDRGQGLERRPDQAEEERARHGRSSRPSRWRPIRKSSARSSTALTSLETTKTIDENPPRSRSSASIRRTRASRCRLTGESAARQIDLGTKTPDRRRPVRAGRRAAEGVPRRRVSRRPGEPDARSICATRRLLKFDRDKADSLKLEPAGAPALSLTKKSSEEWRLTAPMDARAEFSAVDGIVSKLSQAKMKSVVVDDVGKDLKKYGLDKPQAVVTSASGPPARRWRSAPRPRRRALRPGPDPADRLHASRPRCSTT